MNLKAELEKLTPRKTNCHKGDFGHALIIGGDHGMGGAAIMAAIAASRSGAGKTSTLTRNTHLSALIANTPNVMTIDENNLSEEILENKNALAIGPGLGQSSWSKKLFNLAIKSKLPKIIDADALNLIAKTQRKFDLTNSIITPHIGEAARLLRTTTSKINQDREKAVTELHKKYGAICILKGANSLVFGSNEIYKCKFGNPGMATAGMGDVLSGIIVGLIAQNLSLSAAAIFAVNIHALAGDKIAKEIGEVGILPNDLIANLPRIINFDLASKFSD